jgi:predicted Fe-Mo cluster-binding NifX family protein
MKVAMTVWGNRISPVFDSAQTMLIAEIKDGEVLDERREFLPRHVGWQLARMLVEQEIDTLICGAISGHPAEIIQQTGISLIPFVSGNVEIFLTAYSSDQSIESFIMPGCSKDHIVQQEET